MEIQVKTSEGLVPLSTFLASLPTPTEGQGITLIVDGQEVDEVLTFIPAEAAVIWDGALDEIRPIHNQNELQELIDELKEEVKGEDVHCELQIVHHWHWTVTGGWIECYCDQYADNVECIVISPNEDEEE